MSSAGAPGGGGAARYFCHQCNRTVTLTPSAAADLACPVCHGGFLEEFELPDPNPSPSPFMAFNASYDPFFGSASTSALPFLFPETSGSFVLRDPSDLAGLLGPDTSLFRPSSTSPSSGPEPFNPLLFIQNYIQSITAGGANIQLVFEGGGGGPFPGGNLGDYFIGPGLEQLIQQLAENDPNRYGTPPAANSAIKSLPDIKICEDLFASDEAQCAVCKDNFEIGDKAKQMPCKHIYHNDCIIPWLELHNSCPVCRYELPTDDPDYEQRRGSASPTLRAGGPGDLGGASGAAAAAPATPGEGNSPGSRTVERRFRISLPWPFSAFGSQAEASNTEDGSNNGGRQGGADGNSGGQGDRASEPRQEDLD